MHDELVALIEAAGGRTLALFTSWRAMQAAAAAIGPRVPWPVLTQSDLPKPALVARFSRRRALLPVRHHGLLAGRRRARPGAVAGHHRPPPVSPPGRPAPAGPAGPSRTRRLRD